MTTNSGRSTSSTEPWLGPARSISRPRRSSGTAPTQPTRPDDPSSTFDPGAHLARVTDTFDSLCRPLAYGMAKSSLAPRFKHQESAKSSCPTGDRDRDVRISNELPQGAFVEAILADQGRQEHREFVSRGFGECRPIAVQGLRLGCLRPTRPVEAGEHHPGLADGTKERLGRRAKLVPGHRPNAIRLAFRVVPSAGFRSRPPRRWTGRRPAFRSGSGAQVRGCGRARSRARAACSTRERVAQGALVETVLADQCRQQHREFVGRGFGEGRPDRRGGSSPRASAPSSASRSRCSIIPLSPTARRNASAAGLSSYQGIVQTPSGRRSESCQWPASKSGASTMGSAAASFSIS